MAYLFPFAGDDRRPQKLPKPKSALPPRPKVHIPPAPVVVIEPVMPRVETPGMTAQMKQIAEEVCKRHKVTVAELISPSRLVKIIRARREYIFRCRSQLEKSFPQIAKSLNQDHTTCIHAYYKAAENPKSMTPYKRPIPPSKQPKKASVPIIRHPNTNFSDREKITYEYILLGKSNKEIAEITGFTNRQVRHDRYMINRKIQIRENWEE